MIQLLTLVFCSWCGNVSSATERIGPEKLSYNSAESEVARAHTEELRDSPNGITHVDAGEDIIFALDNGINVQFANGSGRRLLIARGTGYRAFTYPTWSLDGASIAFSAQRTDSRVVDLVVANADGSSPTVILTLNDGYYNSMIQSISWSWDNQFIMFNYAFDDNQLNSYFLVCTIRRNGQNYTYVQDFLRSYSQYEPVAQSQRYAYLSTGTAFDANTRLRVSNLNGSNDVVWFTFQGAIAGLTHISWKNANSIYTVIRNWSQYPNKEVLLRIDKTSGGSTWTTIVVSSTGASLWSPSSSPSRTQFYISEMTSTTATLYLVTLGSNGLPTSIDAKGTGFFPNWRQQNPNPVRENGPTIATDFRVGQNYPNPFNPSTTIEFSIPRTSHVTITIHDMLGRHACTLLNEVKVGGTHTVSWDAARFPSGVYFYSVRSENMVLTRRMILLK
jgi:hypothetical protein